MLPKIIGIRFSDNDFTSTIEAFLQAILDTGIEYYVDLDKEKIVKLFNLSAPALYWLVQNRLQYNEDWNPSTYLTISVDKVFFDDEVNEYIKNCKGWDNGEFHVLDTQTLFKSSDELIKGYVYSV